MTATERDALPLAEHPSATVTVYPDGPLIVRGNFAITNVDGTTIPSGGTVALCRCGRSAAKPFCDGSHSRAARRQAQDASGSATDSS